MRQEISKDVYLRSVRPTADGSGWYIEFGNQKFTDPPVEVSASTFRKAILDKTSEDKNVQKFLLAIQKSMQSLKNHGGNSEWINGFAYTTEEVDVMRKVGQFYVQVLKGLA